MMTKRRMTMTMPAMTLMSPRSAERAGRAANGRCVRHLYSRRSCKCLSL